jgi:hypothetical protein
MAAMTVRLPEDLDERLSEYCLEVGAVKNRVISLALRSYLGEGHAPALPVELRHEREGEAALLSEAEELLVEGVLERGR